MNEFKPGDDVWFFTFPEDGCGGFDVSSVDLEVNRNQCAINLTSGYVAYSYKSKNEALDAMIARIEELRKEE